MSLRLLPLLVVGGAAYGLYKTVRAAIDLDNEMPVRPVTPDTGEHDSRGADNPNTPPLDDDFEGEKFDRDGFYTTDYLNYCREKFGSDDKDDPVKPL